MQRSNIDPPQFQNNEPYPHVLALTCEEESCTLRLFPPIPLQGEEEAVSMAKRREWLLSSPTQCGLQSTHQRSLRQSRVGNNANERRKSRPTSSGTNECHSDSEEASQECSYDDSGYSLPNRQQPGQIHYRQRRKETAQRRMSVQTPFFTGSLVTDDDEDWNSRFQKVVEDLVGIGINTHSCESFSSHSHDKPCCSLLFHTQLPD